MNNNAPPHVRRQKGSVAVDEYEQRLSGPAGAPAQTPSHGQEGPPEDKAVEEDGAAPILAGAGGKGSAGAKTCASTSTSADAHHKKAAGGLRRPGPGHAGLDAAELAEITNSDRAFCEMALNYFEEREIVELDRSGRRAYISPLYFRQVVKALSVSNFLWD